LIDNTDTSIVSNITTIKIRKQFSPTLNSSTKYDIYFRNSLYNPVSGYNASQGGILESSGFKVSGDTTNIYFLDDDGAGNVRRYRFLGGTRSYINNTQGTINYSTGQIYRRVGAFSTTPNLPENVMTLSDILDSTTSQMTTFDFETDGKRVKLNDLLIIPENINCYSGEYTFGFPKEIVELTINKEMIPMLLKLGKPGIVKLLKSIETMPNFRSSLNLEDTRLPQKITRLFSNQAQEKERAEIIAELEEYGFEEVEQQVWEEYTISELKGLLGKFKK
jgi:hypothetical protein